MPRISLIAALDRNRVIGTGNRLPWHLSEDLKRFKTLTTGRPVIMGRKTYESIGRPLPGRLNIVITRNEDFAPRGVTVVGSLETALAQAAMAPGCDEIFIIGGGEIYTQSLPRAQRLYLTLVDTEVSGGDAFFPEWENQSFREIERESRNEAHPYSWVTLERVARA